MEVDCSQVDCNKSVDFDRQVVAEELDKQAEDCYFVAATNGYQFAQRRLGEIFAKGLSGKKDIEQAKKWYKMAADQGDDEAIQALKQFKQKEMS